MSEESSSPVTMLLTRWRMGDERAPEALLAILYADLRALAAHRLGSRDGEASFQPTELVHEAYVKLLGSAQRGWTDRRHFIGAASAAMRSVVVDRARAKACLKRGGGETPTSCPIETPATGLTPEEVIQLHEAIQKLETLDPRAASILTLRCFGGLSVSEVALALDISERSARREWDFASRWLRSSLGTELGA